VSFAQFRRDTRRDVRRATPATLTGVSGRPTTASAVGTKKLSTLSITDAERRPPKWSPPSTTITIKIAIPIFFDKLIVYLLS
jgi:hypothetical protein